MTTTDQLPPDLAAFRDSYVKLFGSMPPLPGAKSKSIAEIEPEFLRLTEQQRAHAFYSDVFDVKTTQLLLYGMLLHAGSSAAKFHALAARRAGASWQELQKVAELAAATAASGQFWGVFGFDYCQESYPYDEANTPIFAIAVDSIAAAIER